VSTRLPVVDRRDAVSWVLVIGTSAFAFWFVAHRGQDQNWDLLNYHYYAGYALLEGRFRTDIAAAGVQTFLNPLPNAVSFAALRWLPFPASAWLVATVQLLSLPLLVMLGKELERDLPPHASGWPLWAALALCVLSPLWWSEVGTSFFSSTTAPLVLLGLLAGLRAMPRARAADWASRGMLLSGMAFGLAVGLKLTNALFAVAFAVALAVALLSTAHRSRWRAAAGWCAGAVLGFAATAWWNAYLAMDWGSPVFPLYNAIFRSPYYEPVNLHDIRWRFDSIGDFLAFLGSSVNLTLKTSEVAFADARLAIVACLLVPAFLISLERRVRAGRLLEVNAVAASMIFVCVSVAVWALLFAYQRYLIAVELLLGFAIWILLATLVSDRRILALALVTCLAGAMLRIHVADWRHVPAANHANAFGLALPPELAATAADYLVLSKPISYVFPFLHPQSRFFDASFSRGAQRLILAALASDRSRPVRFIAPKREAVEMPQRLQRLGYHDLGRVGRCWEFRSDFDAYAACEFQRGP
jgi:hypothetical protein